MLSSISESCKILRLSKNIVENCKLINSDTNEEFLFKLLNLEVEHRKNVRNSQLIKKAGFQTLKSFFR